MNKIIIIIVIIAAVALGIWWLNSRQQETPRRGVQQPNDTTQAITDDLQTLDLGDIDREFQSIDADLNANF
ncbi:MAG: hypothetical protein HYS52_01170 [Candidatus Wildermuthbacteria bacterium]|nr:hypothetical protein [Candidatus Wildermuthbacteria bacterium]